VLDREADRMTDMGFYEEIAGIVSGLPSAARSLLFSPPTRTIQKFSPRSSCAIRIADCQFVNDGKSSSVLR
jgi:superfamily II DNA/RNA helicase